MERDVAWVTSMVESAAPQCAAARVRHRADTIYLLVMGGRVLAMQTGFALLEAAYGRPMNSANIMMKNCMDLLIGCFIFYLVGFQLATGMSTEWIENMEFDYAFWFLHFSYATTAATIDSGALGGRVSFMGYLALSVAVTGLIYPVAVSWTWGGGWLKELGYVDFAGSSIVHMVGAMSALVSVCICGPRIGRFPDYRAWRGLKKLIFVERNDSIFYQMPLSEVEKAIYSPIKSCNNPVQLLFGTFLLLCGFLAFNPASTMSTVQDADLLAARITVVTLMSASAGAFACIVVSVIRFRALSLSVPDLTNAVLGGLVSSCAGCHVFPPALGFVVGFVGGCLTLWAVPLVAKWQLDDMVGVVGVHGLPGFWGVLAVPLFARPHCQSSLRGLAFGGGLEALRLLGVQLLGLAALAAFAGAATYVVVVLIDLVAGFRCSRAAELVGLDFVEHRVDDGTLRLDASKAEVLEHTPPRDCLVTRVKSASNVRFTPKSSLEEKAVDQQYQEVASPSVAGGGGQHGAAGHGGDGGCPIRLPSCPSKTNAFGGCLDEEPAPGAPREAPASGGALEKVVALDREAELHSEIARLKDDVGKLTSTLSMLVSGLRSAGSLKDLGFIGSGSDVQHHDSGRRQIMELLTQEATSAAAAAEAQGLRAQPARL